MPKKPSITSSLISRGITASLAGIRAGSALAIDSAVNRALGKNPEESYSEFAIAEADRFVQKLGNLKGTYVKIGQMMALFGEHFLPGVLTQALHRLEDRTQPLSWDDIEPSIRESIGDRIDELDIAPKAIAAASLAQVHRATLSATGDEICLKVQYPGLARVIDREFDSLVKMMLVSRWLQRGRELDAWIKSMRTQLHNEIDYARETALTLKMERHLNRSSQLPCPVRVPEVYPEFCGKHVIGMEYIDGVSPAKLDVEQLSPLRRNALAKTLLELFFKEVFEWGIVQTDPNFGNFLVTPGDEDEPIDTLTLLDFGSAIELSAEEQSYLREIIAGGLQEDRDRIYNGLVGLDWLDKDASPKARKTFTNFCLYLLEPLQPADNIDPGLLNESGKYRWADSQLLQRVGRKGSLYSVNRHFSAPAGSFTLIARKLSGLFTFITVLGAEFNGYDIARKYVLD